MRNARARSRKTPSRRRPPRRWPAPSPGLSVEDGVRAARHLYTAYGHYRRARYLEAAAEVLSAADLLIQGA